MLNLQINDPELEHDLMQTYGNSKQSVIDAFSQFIKQQKIINDGAFLTLCRILLKL